MNESKVKETDVGMPEANVMPFPLHPHSLSPTSNIHLASGPGTFMRMNMKNMRKGREEENECGDERKEQRV